MINLRYHVVSLTAVFLALGIGLAFGAAFIDRATVDQLERNLTAVERQNEELEQQNSELADQLTATERIESGLREEGLDQVVAGRLEDTPLLLLVSSGVNGDLQDAALATAVAAGAEVAGILRITDRFALDDQSEVDDLRTILELPDAGAAQLRTAAIRRVRTLLANAASPSPSPGVDGPPSEVPTPVPALLEQLLVAGFLEFEAADELPAGFVLIPEHDLRVMAVSNRDAAVADDDFLRPLLASLVEPEATNPDASPPVVVAGEPLVPTDDPDAELFPFVEPFRADEVLRARLSTVDTLDSFAGLMAAVMALQYGADGQVGHYGTGESAQAVLPPVPVVDEAGG